MKHDRYMNIPVYILCTTSWTLLRINFKKKNILMQKPVIEKKYLYHDMVLEMLEQWHTVCLKSRSRCF